MAIFLPFRGILPPAELAAKVAAVPYDVVNTAEAAELAKGNPCSFLHVSRPEIDLEPGIDLHDDKVYAQAKIAYDKLCAEVPLTQDEKPHLYVYRLIMNGRSQTGVIGAASAAEYNSGVIKKHEKTRADKEDDRTRHVMTLRSHTGPAFLTYQDSDDIDAIIADEMERLLSLTSPLLTGSSTPCGAWMKTAAANSLSGSRKRSPASTSPTATTAVPPPPVPLPNALPGIPTTPELKITITSSLWPSPQSSWPFCPTTGWCVI
jgi:hypothetical protein